MTSLNISYNHIRAEGGKALAEALNGHSALKELKIADSNLRYNRSNNPDMSGIIAIGKAIPTMQALGSLNMRYNQLVPFKLPEGWSGPDMYGYFERPDGEVQRQPPEGAEPILAGILSLADGIKHSRALTRLTMDDDEYTLPHLIVAMKHMVIECASNLRLWPFIRLHHYTKTKSAKIKEIHALAEAFCMNALPSRTCTPLSNVEHPLRTPWLLRMVLDYML